MGITRSGVKQLMFGGTRLRVRSDVAVSPGGVQREPGQGLDGHRYATVSPRQASIGCQVTVDSRDEFLKLEDVVGETATLSLRDGGVVIVEDAELSVQGEINFDENSAEVLIVGSSLRWLTP